MDHIRLPVKGINKKGIWDYIPGFIYPKRNHIPIMTDIIHELEKRDFQVPDIDVTFNFNGYGTNKYKYLCELKHKNAYVLFCNVQGSIPDTDLNDIAGIDQCHIKGHSIYFARDDFSPIYFKYRGQNWDTDMKMFRRLQQPGSPYGVRSCFSEEEIFNTNLKSLLEYIKSFPETNNREFTNSLCENMDEFQRLKFEPYPDHYPTFYHSNMSYQSYYLVRNFRTGFDKLKDRDKIPDLCYKCCLVDSCGKLLNNSNDPSKENLTINPVSTERFLEVKITNNMDDLLKSFDNWVYNDFAISIIRPHYLDDIYVADLSISHNYKANCFSEDPTLEELSDEQMAHVVALKGVRVVTLKEYIENNVCFQKPQYFLHHKIGYDEIQRMYHVRANQPIEIIDKVYTL